LKTFDIEIFDISLINQNKNKKMHNFKIKTNRFSALGLVIDRIPNYIFKFFEILYNIYPLLVGYYKLTRNNLNQQNVLFFYDRYAYFSFGVVFLAKLFRKPYVIEVNTTCLDYDVRPMHFRYLAKIIEKYVFKQAKLITVVSGYLKNKIVSEYNIKNSKIIITPNAINPSDYEFLKVPNSCENMAAVKNFCKGKIIIGFIGVFVPWHGLNFLIEVFETILDKYSDKCRIGLLLVGDGPTRSDVENSIVQKNIIDYVHITGFVDHCDVKSYIDMFDIAVMPDSNPFGSPMKIFEYMAMGKAIVAPKYGPIEEVIRHGFTGELFEIKNFIDCKEKISKLIADGEKRKEIGLSAQKYVFEQHTWKKNIQNIFSKLMINI